MTSEGKIAGVKWASRGSPGGYRWVLLAVRRPVCLLASNASLKSKAAASRFQLVRDGPSAWKS